MDAVMSKDATTKTALAIGPKKTLPPVEWTCRTGWLGEKNPCFPLGVLLILVGLVALFTGKGYLAVVAGLGLVAICWQNLCSVSYHADQDGIRQTVIGRSRFKPWTDIAAIHVHHDALVLILHNTNRSKIATLPIRIPLGSAPLEVRTGLRELVPHLIEDDVSNDPREDGR
jgi:hypothetical protein